ncbi:hypothetical protein [Paraburkholderia phenazinium]|jgi:hypothetical protein|uniref:Uncharacterized protein n=1 Tax=Paraburkholderia phenazinium TaxID=60549 RepID=A0A1G8C4Q3_9BURK|nr:hypothetical protein [Paraburkholderia phenazinium]SDH39930.1 hypothetical protein SAMN05216466_109255 [Paraburkholderia phenazinium]
MKHGLIGLLTVLPASVGSTFSGTHAAHDINVAMLSPVELSPTGHDPAPEKTDLTRIIYTSARSSRGPTIAPSLLNNESFNGERHVRLRGDRFEWQWRENSK